MDYLTDQNLALQRRYARIAGQQVPVSGNEFFVMHHRGFNYYVIELGKVPFERLGLIIQSCEEVERDTWRAQENFDEYVRRSRLLAYAEKDGEIVGFNLVSLLLRDKYGLYVIDEAMVMNRFHHQNLARNIVLITMRWFAVNIARYLRFRRVAIVSISSNPRVINLYYKNKYLSMVFDNSFKPSPGLVEMIRDYAMENKLEFVDETNPFCLKNLFPNSSIFDPDDPRYRFREGVQPFLAHGFDYYNRGDAFVWMIRGWMFYFHTLSTLVAFLYFGVKSLTNSAIGVFQQRKSIL